MQVHTLGFATKFQPQCSQSLNKADKPFKLNLFIEDNGYIRVNCLLNYETTKYLERYSVTRDSLDNIVAFIEWQISVEGISVARLFEF